MSWRVRSVALAVVLALAAAAAGCRVPADPDGTLDRVSGGVMRVGIAHNPPWTEVRGSEGGGLEAELAEGFARRLDARVEWTVDTEAELVERLELGELDLVVAGLTKKTPWSKHAAVTRPYAEAPNRQGKPEPHVMAAPLGENAFLVELERYLAQREADVARRLEAAP
jgi:polar amino acid transport system substrate-binding protein